MSDPVILAIDAGHYGDGKCRKDGESMPCTAILEARKRRTPIQHRELHNRYEPGKAHR